MLQKWNISVPTQYFCVLQQIASILLLSATLDSVPLFSANETLVHFQGLV